MKNYHKILIDGKYYWDNQVLPKQDNLAGLRAFRLACIKYRYIRLKNLEATADTLGVHINRIRQNLKRIGVKTTMNNNRGAFVNYIEQDTIKLKELEKYLILTRLVQCKGNKSNTARSLGIGVRTLQRKLNSYGVGANSYGRMVLKDIQPDAVMMAQQLIAEIEGGN